MAQHRCITQLAKNVYRARPTADILTIDSRLNNYSFRLKKHTLSKVRDLVYISFSCICSRAFRRSVIFGLGAPTYSVLHARLLLTYYYILVPWTTPGTPVGQDNVRRTHDLQDKKQNYKIVVERDPRFIPLLRCRGCSRGPG